MKVKFLNLGFTYNRNTFALVLSSKEAVCPNTSTWLTPVIVQVLDITFSKHCLQYQVWIKFPSSLLPLYPELYQNIYHILFCNCLFGCQQNLPNEVWTWEAVHELVRWMELRIKAFQEERIFLCSCRWLHFQFEGNWESIWANDRT